MPFDDLAGAAWADRLEEDGRADEAAMARRVDWRNVVSAVYRLRAGSSVEAIPGLPATYRVALEAWKGGGEVRAAWAPAINSRIFVMAVRVEDSLAVDLGVAPARVQPLPWRVWPDLGRPGRFGWQDSLRVWAARRQIAIQADDLLRLFTSRRTYLFIPQIAAQVSLPRPSPVTEVALDRLLRELVRLERLRYVFRRDRSMPYGRGVKWDGGGSQ